MVGPDAKLEQDPSAQQCKCGFPLILCSNLPGEGIWIFRSGSSCGTAQPAPQCAVGTMWSLHMLQTQHHILSDVQGGASDGTLSTGM